MEVSMSKPVIDPKKSYTFSDYFELNPPIDELLAYFGYSRQVEVCTLPHTTSDLSFFTYLANHITAHLKVVDLDNETARRETLVAPILFEIGVYLQTKVKVEHKLNVTKQLKGKLDYYLQHHNNLLIVEAKYSDLPRGFTQLAVELIALDQWLDEGQTPIHGIVTVGDIWRFGILDRTTKVITQDINSYRVPADLQELLAILIAILEGGN
jgi:hypothetical protein